VIPAHLIDRARLVPVENVVAERGIRLRGTVDRSGACPRCGGEDRFSIHTGKQVFNCRQCGAKGGVIDLTMFLDNCALAAAVETLSGERITAETAAGLGPIKAVYDYVDEAGELLFQVLRFEPKQFRQRTGPDQKRWSVEGVRIVPFRLPELIEDIALDRAVFIVEGEKDVLTLRDLGVPASCNAMGAGKWREDFNVIFRDADVVVCADNDKPGRGHAELVARNLHGIAKRVRALDLRQFWPEIGEGDDISDWVTRGKGTAERLYEIVDELPDWTPKINGEAVLGGAAPGANGANKPVVVKQIAPAFSDEALALRFADLHGPHLRYVAKWGQWLSWAETHWRPDDTLHAFDLARRVIREAATACNKSKKIAAAIASAKTVAAVERLSKSDRRLAATADQWDAQIIVFNTPTRMK
jgi:putative DNA primase/helicase